MGCIKQYHELSHPVCWPIHSCTAKSPWAQVRWATHSTKRAENFLIWQKPCKAKNVTKDSNTKCQMEHTQTQKCYSPVLTCHLFPWWVYWHLHNHFDLIYLQATAERINYSPFPYTTLLLKQLKKIRELITRDHFRRNWARRTERKKKCIKLNHL